MSTIKVTTLSTQDGAYSISSDTLTRAACRAWVNFDGTGTVAIRAQYNVSSITDHGTGDYTVNFTTAMSDANYCFSGGAGLSSSDLMCVVQPRNTYAPTTSSCRFQVIYNANTFYDVPTCNVAIFR